MTDFALAEIGFNADILDDLERVKIANQNRLRTLTADRAKVKGGQGIPSDLPEIKRLQKIVDALEVTEKDATKSLEASMKKHPVYPWVQKQKGIGAKQVARLLAVTGDLKWNDTYDCPRTVSQLWAYCGLHNDESGVSVQRQKGVQSNWSSKAKSRAYLVAESCMKQLKKECKTEDGVEHYEDCDCSTYRVLYDDRKDATKGRLHKVDCRRCGPKGKPAKAGSVWSDAHRHADALRFVSKRILRDLWIEANKH